VQTLDCGHSFHRKCVDGIRQFGIAQTCPMCRAALPPGAEQRYERAVRKYLLIEMRYQSLEDRYPTIGSNIEFTADRTTTTTSSLSTARARQKKKKTSVRRSKADLEELKQVRHTWRELANEGHGAALGALALLHEQGRGGVAMDEVEAARLYKEGAAHGDR
jgi:TPR repeat protein